MPLANITEARYNARFIYISARYWGRPIGAIGNINILLGDTNQYELARFRTYPGGYGWVTCHSLYYGAPRCGLPLPLQLNDQVDYEMENGDIRIRRIIRGGAGAPAVAPIAPRPLIPPANPPA